MKTSFTQIAKKILSFKPATLTRDEKNSLLKGALGTMIAGGTIAGAGMFGHDAAINMAGNATLLSSVAMMMKADGAHIVEGAKSPSSSKTEFSM